MRLSGAICYRAPRFGAGVWVFMGRSELASRSFQRSKDREQARSYKGQGQPSSLRFQPDAAQDDCGDGLYRLVELLV